MSFMQYEDAMKVYKYFNLNEPNRPIVENFGNLFGSMLSECPYEQVYIPITYEEKFDINTLFGINYFKTVNQKIIHKQCRHCLEYYRLQYVFNQDKCYLVTKQVFDVMYGAVGRTFLCDCAVYKRNGSYKIIPINVTGESVINELLNESSVITPQKKS